MARQQPLFQLQPPRIGQVEEQLTDRGMTAIVGVDEAGRGPLAGPVYAAAFALELGEESLDQLAGLDDSKKLDGPRRDELYERLTGGYRPYAIASVGADIIDELNVLQATFRAMKQAVNQVLEKLDSPPDLVLIDGNMSVPGAPWRQRPIVGGDARSLAIAAASILAKVARDRFMCRADEQWPQYGFASHKGYGTPQHRRALKEFGPCKLHRRSFSGVLQSPS